MNVQVIFTFRYHFNRIDICFIIILKGFFWFCCYCRITSRFLSWPCFFNWILIFIRCSCYLRIMLLCWDCAHLLLFLIFFFLSLFFGWNYFTINFSRINTISNNSNNLFCFLLRNSAIYCFLFFFLFFFFSFFFLRTTLITVTATLSTTTLALLLFILLLTIIRILLLRWSFITIWLPLLSLFFTNNILLLILLIFSLTFLSF